MAKAKKESDHKRIDEILRTAVCKDDIKAVCRFFMSDDPYGQRAKAVDAILKTLSPRTPADVGEPAAWQARLDPECEWQPVGNPEPYAAEGWETRPLYTLA